jgi:hypothetical protein
VVAAKAIIPAVAAVGVGLALAGFGSSADGVSAASPPGGDGATPPIVDCESRIQTSLRNPPDPSDQRLRRTSLFAGPVIFFGAKNWRKYPRKFFKPERPGGLRPTKIPLLLKADREVTVNVLAPQGHTALLTLGLDQAPYRARGTSVTLRSCPAVPEVPGQRFGPWTPFLGGIKVDAPMCVGIQVEADGATEPVEKNIAFGKRTRRTCPAT